MSSSSRQTHTAVNGYHETIMFCVFQVYRNTSFKFTEFSQLKQGDSLVLALAQEIPSSLRLYFQYLVFCWTLFTISVLIILRRPELDSVFQVCPQQC